VKHWRLVATVGVLTSYCLARSWVYEVYPARSLAAWFERDTLMTAPRLAAFVLLFGIYTGWRRPGEWKFRGGAWLVVGAFGMAALWWVYFSGGVGEKFGGRDIVVGAATSLVVGLFEEYAYRGPPLMELGQCVSERAAISVSSLLFMLYHFQAQNLESWPTIFLTGVTLANLRCRGLSLSWLVLAHGVTDTGYFIFGSQAPPFMSFPGMILVAGTLVCALRTLPANRSSVPENPNT